ncbi:MAG: hypothetical protein FJY07_04965 [Bacteroidetes bacterium]|nr:hypothetical protein [Bacteroidota bacterium]
MNFKSVNEATGRFYTWGNWDSLIVAGRDAIRNNIDYFILRQRLGIAWYNKQNYSKASRHFEKAMKFNAQDATTMDYLYRSYLALNRTGEARMLSSRFTLQLHKNFATSELSLPDKLYFEPGFTFSNNKKVNAQKHEQINGSLSNQADLIDDIYYLHINAALNPGRKLTVYLGYTYVNLLKHSTVRVIKPVSTGVVLIPWNNGYFVGNDYEETTDLLSKDIPIHQNQAYTGISYTLQNGFIVSPAFHYLYTQTRVVKSTPYEFYAQQIDTIPVILYSPGETDSSFQGYVGSIEMNKYLSQWNFAINGSVSNLNRCEQYQAGCRITYYPFGNLDLYFIATGVISWEKSAQRWILGGRIGHKTFRKLWSEVHFTAGEIVNYNELNGAVVYNSGDRIRLKCGIDFIVPLPGRFGFTVKYQYLAQEGYEYMIERDYSFVENTVKYRNHTISGGIIWKI